MITAAFGMVISILSFAFVIIKTIGKKSSGYMRKEMDAIYFGTKK